MNTNTGEVLTGGMKQLNVAFTLSNRIIRHESIMEKNYGKNTTFTLTAKYFTREYFSCLLWEGS